MQLHEHLRTAIGSDVRARREAAALTRAELARRAIVDASTIYRLENEGQASPMSRRRIEAALVDAEREVAA